MQIGKEPQRHETFHQIVIRKIPGINKMYNLRQINKFKEKYNLTLKYSRPQKVPINVENDKILAIINMSRKIINKHMPLLSSIK